MTSTVAEQTELLSRHLPSGRAFGAKNVQGTVTRGILQGLASEMLRNHDLIRQFRDEVLPDETTFLIEEWESAVGIPDDCFKNVSGSIEDRRRNVLAKLVSLGVQTADDFVALAALFGITATITAGSVHGTFPFKFPMIFFPDERAARHTILVDLQEPEPLGFPYTFPIVFQSAELALVECLFLKVKPAHVDVKFVDFS